MEPDALFEIPDGARVEKPPPTPKTPGELMRARQADRLSRGIHPLSRPGWPPIPLHKDAAPAADKTAPGLRCGGCKWREALGYHNRTYPKCLLPDSSGQPDRATHSDTSDVRAWWPACNGYEAKAETTD